MRMIKKFFHLCHHHLVDDVIWYRDDAMPVTGVPSTCGQSSGGVMYLGDSQSQGWKLQKCSICGKRCTRIIGKPKKIEWTYIDPNHDLSGCWIKGEGEIKLEAKPEIVKAKLEAKPEIVKAKLEKAKGLYPDNGYPDNGYPNWGGYNSSNR